MIPIGIAGAAGVGKTTLAHMLVELSGGHGLILPFSKPLKDFALLLGWDGKKDDKGRRLLQLLGTECGRECIDVDIWVKKWTRIFKLFENGLSKLGPDEWVTEWLAQCKDSKVNIVIADDMRFQNEYDAIKKMNGFVIKLYGRQEQSSIDRKHASERGLPDKMFPMLIDNSKNLDHLQEVAKYLIEKVQRNGSLR